MNWNGWARGAIWPMMSGAVLMGAVLAQPAAMSQSQFVNTLMPQPAQLTVSSGGLDIAHGVSISLDKFHDASTTPSHGFASDCRLKQER